MARLAYRPHWPWGGACRGRCDARRGKGADYVFGGRRWCLLAEGGPVPGDIEATSCQRIGHLPERSAPAMLYRCDLTRYAKAGRRATVTLTGDPNSPSGVYTNQARGNAVQNNPLPPSSIGPSAVQLTRQLLRHMRHHRPITKTMRNCLRYTARAVHLSI